LFAFLPKYHVFCQSWPAGITTTNSAIFEMNKFNTELTSHIRTATQNLLQVNKFWVNPKLGLVNCFVISPFQKYSNLV